VLHRGWPATLRRCQKKRRLEAGMAAVAYNSGLPALTKNMSNVSPAVVTESAYLTLHYRLAGADGTDIVTTFGTNPATLMLGQGQLAPFLEERLLGMAEGEHKTFTLSPLEAFGERNPELLQWVSKATLDANSTPDADYKAGDLVDFAAPGGGRFAGMLREMREDAALFDFNHPLAGQALHFEVKLISVL
jgi:FKBP-type peptidyl-prolyl cis-trans isomerase SlpA